MDFSAAFIAFGCRCVSSCRLYRESASDCTRTTERCGCSDLRRSRIAIGAPRSAAAAHSTA